MSGFYCTNCGKVQQLGSGFITCVGCGHSGLRGFSNKRPRRIGCLAGCAWGGWDDGGVNDDLGRHMRAEHDCPRPPRLSEPQWLLYAEIAMCGTVYVRRDSRYHRTAEALVRRGLIEVTEPDYSTNRQDGYSLAAALPQEQTGEVR